MTPAEAITRNLGGTWRGDRGAAPCPICQTERRFDQRALSLRDDGGQLLVYCHKTGCEFRAILKALGLPPSVAGTDNREAKETGVRRQAYDAEQLAKARRLWDSGKPIGGTKAETYLRSRGITSELPPSLRWVSDIYHAPSTRWLSAMVADVTTGGVHRTFFEKGGARLSRNAKLMLGPCAGGAVTLAAQQGPLVACEGIETGLSLLSGLLAGPASVWAALSTSGMRALRLPAIAGELIIAADSDDDGAGHGAAEALAMRAHRLGWHVTLLPAPAGMDWNDALQAGVLA